MLQLFTQTMAALHGKKEAFSREFIQWLRGLVDQVNGLPSDAAPQNVSTSAAAGTGAQLSRDDHVHAILGATINAALSGVGLQITNATNNYVVGNNADTQFIVETGGAGSAGNAILGLLVDGNQAHYIKGARANNRMEILGGGIDVLVENNTSQTATAKGLIVKHKTSGAAVDGFGTGVYFAIEDNNEAETRIGKVDCARYEFGGDVYAYLDIFTSLNGSLKRTMYLEPNYAAIIGDNVDTYCDLSSGGASTSGDAILRINADGNQSHRIRSRRASNRMEIQGGGNAIKVENDGTAATNTALGGIELKRTTLGNMADGFGVGIHFQIEDDAAVENSIAAVIAVRDGADNSGHLEVWTSSAGSYAERMRITKDGRVGIGATPATSAALEVSSTTGALLVPRMTSAERDALTAVNGMIIYNTTTSKFQGYEAGAWVNLI